MTDKSVHLSSCAVHNAPAYPPGPCDCGGNASAAEAPAPDLDGEELHALREENNRLTAEVERLRTREKDLTLEGLALIGKLEQVRDILAGTDVSSLPNDYSVTQMATDRMEEITRLQGIEELYKAGCAAWNPVYKVVLDERDALRAEVLRLRAALEWMANAYDTANPMRQADVHAPICSCLRCARDNARAALTQEPRT